MLGSSLDRSARWRRGRASEAADAICAGTSCHWMIHARFSDAAVMKIPRSWNARGLCCCASSRKIAGTSENHGGVTRAPAPSPSPTPGQSTHHALRGGPRVPRKPRRSRATQSVQARAQRPSPQGPAPCVGRSRRSHRGTGGSPKRQHAARESPSENIRAHSRALLRAV